MIKMLSWDTEAHNICYSQTTHRIAKEVNLLFLETVLRTFLLLYDHLKAHRDTEALSVPPSH